MQGFLKRMNNYSLVKLVLELWNQLKVNGGNMEYQPHKILRVLTSTVSCDVTPCCLVEVYRRFGSTYCLHFQVRTVILASNRVRMLKPLDLLFNPEDGGTTFHRNAGKHLPDYTA
jgi:hypothetical protein